MNVQMWIQKQQRRNIFAKNISKVLNKIALYERDVTQCAFDHLREFSDRLGTLESMVNRKSIVILQAKAFYFWTNRYIASREETAHLHDLVLKRRVFRHFDVLKR
jgi:hypothetical protein